MQTTAEFASGLRRQLYREGPTLSTVAVLATFVSTTLVNEPNTLTAMAVILLVSVALDLGWRSRRASKPNPPPIGPDAATSAAGEGHA